MLPVRDKFAEYGAWGAEAIKSWEKAPIEYGLPCFPHVSIGLDNNARHINFTPSVAMEATLEKFRIFLEQAKTRVNRDDLPAPLITVNSWNE